MDDAEKAVKGLKCCSPHEVGHCKDCPYHDEFDCTARMSQDALDLIESQQEEIERLKEMQRVDNCERCRFKDKCLTGRQLVR